MNDELTAGIIQDDHTGQVLMLGYLESRGSPTYPGNRTRPLSFAQPRPTLEEG